MFEGLVQPAHLVVLPIILLVIVVPGFVVLRLLWKAGTRLGKP